MIDGPERSTVHLVSQFSNEVFKSEKLSCYLPNYSKCFVVLSMRSVNHVRPSGRLKVGGRLGPQRCEMLGSGRSTASQKWVLLNESLAQSQPAHLVKPYACWMKLKLRLTRT
jgi:hypothetical protein